jgi:hypothetical protein
VTVIAWISASWVLSSLIAAPLIGTFIKYGLDEERAPARASGTRKTKQLNELRVRCLEAGQAEVTHA